MKSSIGFFVGVVACVSVSSIFCITFENATPYPVEITYKICEFMGIHGEAIRGCFRNDRHVFLVPAHSSISQAIPYSESRLKRINEGLELIDVVIIKDGNKESLDVGRFHHISWRLMNQVFTVVPWTTGYRLVQLVQ